MKKKLTAKVGASNGNARVCLWNLCLLEAGFTFGKPIEVKAILGGPRGFKGKEPGRIEIRVEPFPFASRRRVSRVMNHGKALPVIDLKTTKALDLGAVLHVKPGDRVEVTVTSKALGSGLITIKKGGAS